MNNILRSVSIAIAALVFFALPTAATPVAHAADLSYPDYGSTYIAPDYSYSDYGSTYIAPDYTNYGYTDYGSTYVAPDYTDYGSTYIAPNYTPSYSYTPSTTYYPSFNFVPATSGGNTQHQQQQQQQTSTNVNNNVNNNNVTVNVPSTYSNEHQGRSGGNYHYTPSCASGYYGSYPNCYRNTPVVYNNPAPYVALTAVPYTGLDLGPVGTALYWGFLVLWCLFAAYLIVVKRAHMSFYRWYKKALFGEETPASAPAMQPAFAGFSQGDLANLASMLRAVVDGPRAAQTAKAHVEPAQEHGVDPFIFSQIHRGKRA